MVKLVGKRTTLNILQKVPTQIRGGIMTVVGSGGFTEAGISQGAWSTYRAAVGNRAIIKGSLVLNALGTNVFIEATVFDNVNGRIIPVARVDANQPSDKFEVEVDRELTPGVRGDNAANDGSCEVIAYIHEVPI